MSELLIMAFEPYQLSEVLAIANVHPFYVAGSQYPPDQTVVQSLTKKVKNEKEAENDSLSSRPLIWKKDL